MAQHTDPEAADPLNEVGEDAPEGVQPFKQRTPAPPARVEPVVVPRWVQMMLLPLGIVRYARFKRQRGTLPAA